MKIRNDIDFKQLEAIGFIEDECNVSEGDHYYSGNNYYYEFDEESRLVVNMLDREMSILTLSDDRLCGVYSLDKILEMFKMNMIEMGV